MNIIKTRVGFFIMSLLLLCCYFIYQYDKSQIVNSKFLSRVEGFISRTKEFCPFCGNTFTVTISELEKDLYRIRLEAKPPENSESFRAFIEIDTSFVFIYSSVELEDIVNTSFVDQFYPRKYKDYYAQQEYDNIYAEEVIYDRQKDIFREREFVDYLIDEEILRFNANIKECNFADNFVSISNDSISVVYYPNDRIINTEGCYSRIRLMSNYDTIDGYWSLSNDTIDFISLRHGIENPSPSFPLLVLKSNVTPEITYSNMIFAGNELFTHRTARIKVIKVQKFKNKSVYTFSHRIQPDWTDEIETDSTLGQGYPVRYFVFDDSIGLLNYWCVIPDNKKFKDLKKWDW